MKSLVQVHIDAHGNVTLQGGHDCPREEALVRYRQFSQPDPARYGQPEVGHDQLGAAQVCTVHADTRSEVRLLVLLTLPAPVPEMDVAELNALLARHFARPADYAGDLNATLAAEQRLSEDTPLYLSLLTRRTRLQHDAGRERSPHPALAGALTRALALADLATFRAL